MYVQQDSTDKIGLELWTLLLQPLLYLQLTLDVLRKVLVNDLLFS